MLTCFAQQDIRFSDSLLSRNVAIVSASCSGPRSTETNVYNPNLCLKYFQFLESNTRMYYMRK